MRKLFGFIFLLLLFSQVALAVSPFINQEAPESTLQVVFPETSYFKSGVDFELHFHVVNRTGGILSGAEVDYCEIHLYDKKNSHVLITNLTPDGLDYSVNINSSISSRAGLYSYNVFCSAGFGSDGFVSGGFEITNTGYDNADSRSLALMVSVCLTAFIIIYFAFKLDSGHFLLQLFLVFFSIVIIQIVPATLIVGVDNTMLRYYLSMIWLFRIFITYIIIYISWHYFQKSEKLMNIFRVGKRE